MNTRTRRSGARQLPHQTRSCRIQVLHHAPCSYLTVRAFSLVRPFSQVHLLKLAPSHSSRGGRHTWRCSYAGRAAVLKRTSGLLRRDPNLDSERLEDLVAAVGKPGQIFFTQRTPRHDCPLPQLPEGSHISVATGSDAFAVLRAYHAHACSGSPATAAGPEAGILLGWSAPQQRLASEGTPVGSSKVCNVVVSVCVLAEPAGLLAMHLDDAVRSCVVVCRSGHSCHAQVPWSVAVLHAHVEARAHLGHRGSPREAIKASRTSRVCPKRRCVRSGAERCAGRHDSVSSREFPHAYLRRFLCQHACSSRLSQTCALCA